MVYLGSLTNFDLVYAWTQDKCVPLVREITFENGEVSSPLFMLLISTLPSAHKVYLEGGQGQVHLLPRRVSDWLLEI